MSRIQLGECVAEFPIDDEWHLELHREASSGLLRYLWRMVRVQGDSREYFALLLSFAGTSALLPSGYAPTKVNDWLREHNDELRVFRDNMRALLGDDARSTGDA